MNTAALRAAAPKDTFGKLVGATLAVLVPAAILGLWHLSTEVALLQAELARVESDRARDDAQDGQLRIMWREHSWERQAINDLQARAGVPITAPVPNNGP